MIGETRPGIQFYIEDLENICDVLQPKEVVELIHICVEYVRYGAVTALDATEKRLLRSIWRPLKSKLDRDGKAYDTKKIKAVYSRFCRTIKATNPCKEVPDFETWYETIYSSTNVENVVRSLPSESETAPEAEAETESISKTVTRAGPPPITAHRAKEETEGVGGEVAFSILPRLTEVEFERARQDKMGMLRAY